MNRNPYFINYYIYVWYTTYPYIFSFSFELSANIRVFSATLLFVQLETPGRLHTERCRNVCFVSAHAISR